MYKAHEYSEVILQMTVIKRLQSTVLPTRDMVMKVITFDSLLADSESIEENFRAYLNGFSENIQYVLTDFEIDNHITKLAKTDKLFRGIQKFNSTKGYRGDNIITCTIIGYILICLLKRFSESNNEDAEEHFREILVSLQHPIDAEVTLLTLEHDIVLFKGKILSPRILKTLRILLENIS